MRGKPLFILILMLLTGYNLSFSQDYNIIGDTIKVSANAHPSITFPEDIQDATPSCSKGEYNISMPGRANKLKIRPGSDNPASPCWLEVTEGTGKKQRSHRFIIVYVNGSEQFELFHDYTSLDKIQERVAYLQNRKKQGGAQRNGNSEQRQANTYKEAERQEEPEEMAANTSENTSSYETVLGELHINPKDFDDRLHLKINALNRCMEQLISKTGTLKDNIDYGMQLFNNDESKLVEVTNSKSDTPISYPVKIYFTRLSRLGYSNASVEWSNTQYVGNLVQQSDGRWFGVVIFEQKFTGYKGERAVYTDFTRKTLQIELKVWKEFDSSGEKEVWDVYFGNIGVRGNS